MTLWDALPWLGSVTGVLGALLLALNNKASGYGFVLFLVSNVFWLAFGLMSGLTSMVVMQSVFTVTSLIGIYRWLIAAKAATFGCKTSLEGARWLGH